MNNIMFAFLILSIAISMPMVFAESIEIELEESMKMTTNEKPKDESKKTVELDESLKMTTNNEKPEQTTILSPLKQIKEGIAPKDIQCKSSMELIFKHSGEPACVKTTSVEKIISRGWTS
ncbi:hypothetical protein [Nitrosopumilus sp.]|uniref:hypothetical protein n=1 Tax=Nitrosopumilus sp. TaxID=2024843 RepID=UPI00247DD8A2|nr:hypothetical protein [Nitrosopumilus sp.]MCV0430029.1 hypothetical protein [Nitrosopumilus sp.]